MTDCAKPQPAVTYAEAGVDTAEGARAVEAIRASVQSTYRPEVVGDIGGFGGLFSAAALKAMADPLLVSGTDGVGTKLELARQWGAFDTVGIDLVAMCVNDVLVCGAEPLFFLDYLAVGKLDRARAATLVGGVAEGCRQAGCALIGGEMAEHPGVMRDDDYDMSGFCVGVVDRPLLIDGCDIAAGDVVLGLASSGLHSNGFSLVRRVVEGLDLAAPYDELGGQSLGEALLTPTRIYVEPVRALLAATGAGGAAGAGAGTAGAGTAGTAGGVSPVKGMAHITGGGITENLNRILPSGLDALLKKGHWDVPPVVQFIIDRAGLDEEAALRTFNCGIGYCLVVAAADAPRVTDTLLASGEVVYHLGSIEEGTGVVRYE